MIVRMSPPYRFPKACPRCARPADATRAVVLRKGGGWAQFLGFLGGVAATYTKYRVDVPYCRGCNLRYRLLRGAFFGVPLLLGAVAFALMTTADIREWPAAARWALAGAFLLGVLSPVFWFVGRDLFSDLRLRDVDPASGTVELRIGSTAYGTRLRELNSAAGAAAGGFSGTSPGPGSAPRRPGTGGRGSSGAHC